MASSLEVSKDAATLVRSWLCSPSTKKVKFPHSYPVILPRSERCGLGAESMQKSEGFTKSKVKEKLRKSFKRQSSSMLSAAAMVPSTTVPSDNDDPDEDSKVAVIEQTAKQKSKRTALSALLKKRRNKKRKRDISLSETQSSLSKSELIEKHSSIEEEDISEETDTSLAQPLKKANTCSYRSRQKRKKGRTL